jgi:hypothetical protein
MENGLMRTAIFGVCVWLCAAVCSAASPFDGKWTGTFLRPAPAGNQDVTITLITDAGGKVTGSMTLQGVTGDVPIEWGYVKDDLITYRIKAPGPNNAVVVFVYLGKLTGDQIDFGRRPDDLTIGLLVKGTAKRAP